MKRWKWLIAVLAVAALAIGGLLVVATASAQDGGDRPGMLERVAGKLGIDVETLRGAFTEARLDAVDEALAAGRINEEQAATARERIEQGKPPYRLARARAMLDARQAIVRSAAAALGVTAEELRAELRDGGSIASVAAERGVSIDDVKGRIVSDAETKLASLVAEGRMDQAQADAALARLTSRLDQIVERTRGS